MRPTARSAQVSAVIGLLCLAWLPAGRGWAASCGPAPKAAPQRWTGGESFPPLPLPATPLRRSEKKRPPAPPPLIAKLQYGKEVEGTDEKGNKYKYLDWTNAAGDMQGLLARFNQDLGLRYRGVELNPVANFPASPKEFPILYLTGREPFSFSAELRSKLRWYLQDGGTLLCNASSGSEDYLKAFVTEINTIFPKQKMQLLTPDHPVFSCYYKLGEMDHRDKDGKYFRQAPQLMGINIGCRAAVIFSPYDLACGWDGHTHDTGRRVWSEKTGPEDAYRIGVNILTYVLAESSLGRALASDKVYFEQAEPAGDSLVFAQVVHGGDWDPTPAAAMNLFKHCAEHSTLGVKFRREPVDLAKAEAFSHPVLYMTGHDDFKLSEKEADTLRSYLKGGGLLVADACCGRKAFDAAFRRELGRVFAEAKLEPLPKDSPVYSAGGGEPITRVTYSPMLAKNKPDLLAPSLEGLTVGGQLVVIYSRYGLGQGWQGEMCPYALAYSSRDALKLGMNILVYALAH